MGKKFSPRRLLEIQLFVTLLLFRKVHFCHFRCRLMKRRNIENLQIEMDRPINSANTDTSLTF
jgi:glutathionyl-hydroquinone reductase